MHYVQHSGTAVQIANLRQISRNEVFGKFPKDFEVVFRKFAFPKWMVNKPKYPTTVPTA
jgi:hypothetical protein